MEGRVIDSRARNTAILILNPIVTQKSKPGLWTFVLLSALSCATPNLKAASLFGDLSCQAWADLDYSRKKAWTNAFLAPLSLTHQGLRRTKQDRFNDDPNGFEPAVVSIDTFCLAHPQLSPADGAVSYLNSLNEN